MPACLARIENTDIYILAAEGFPLPDLEIEGIRFVDFDESKGLYVPE